MLTRLKLYLLIGIPVILLLTFLGISAYRRSGNNPAALLPFLSNPSLVQNSPVPKLYGKPNNEGDVVSGSTKIIDANTIELTVAGNRIKIPLDDKTVFSCMASQQNLNGQVADISTAFTDTSTIVVPDRTYKILNYETLIQPSEVSGKIYPNIRFWYVAPKTNSFQKVVFFDCH